MNFILKLPGPLLIFFGACCLSFGGLIVKSFEGATLWQILFWRQFFFIIVVSFFLLTTYKKQVFKINRPKRGNSRITIFVRSKKKNSHHYVRFHERKSAACDHSQSEKTRWFEFGWKHVKICTSHPLAGGFQMPLKSPVPMGALLQSMILNVLRAKWACAWNKPMSAENAICGFNSGG